LSISTGSQELTKYSPQEAILGGITAIEMRDQRLTSFKITIEINPAWYPFGAQDDIAADIAKLRLGKVTIFILGEVIPE